MPFPGARVPPAAGLPRLAVAVRPVVPAAAVACEGWGAGEEAAGVGGDHSLDCFWLAVDEDGPARRGGGEWEAQARVESELSVPRGDEVGRGRCSTPTGVQSRNGRESG